MYVLYKYLLLVRRNFSKRFQRRRNEKSLRTTGLYLQNINFTLKDCEAYIPLNIVGGGAKGLEVVRSTLFFRRVRDTRTPSTILEQFCFISSQVHHLQKFAQCPTFSLKHAYFHLNLVSLHPTRVAPSFTDGFLTNQ